MPLTPLTLRLAAELAVGADLAGDAGDLGGEAASWSTIEFTTVPMRRNSPFTGWPSMSRRIFWPRSPSATELDDAGDLGGRPGEVVDEAVDGVDLLGPAAVGGGDRRGARRGGPRGRRPGSAGRSPC